MKKQCFSGRISCGNLKSLDFGLLCQEKNAKSGEKVMRGSAF